MCGMSHEFVQREVLDVMVVWFDVLEMIQLQPLQPLFLVKPVCADAVVSGG